MHPRSTGGLVAAEREGGELGELGGGDINSIFSKLDLAFEEESHRWVKAVLLWLAHYRPSKPKIGVASAIPVGGDGHLVTS